jgi:hypothetical protein
MSDPWGEDILIIELGTPGPAGAGITAPEKTGILDRLTAIESNEDTHTHAVTTPIVGRTSRTGGAVGTFNNTTANGTPIESLRVTLAGLDTTKTYLVEATGFANISAAPASGAFVSAAAQIEGVLGTFHGHSTDVALLSVSCETSATVSGVTTVTGTINCKNNISASHFISDGQFKLKATPLRTGVA